MTESKNPGVIVRGMTMPETCDGCRFLLADTYKSPIIGIHTTYSCMALENQLEAGVPDGLRTSRRLEACPLEPLPEEIHTDCRIDLGPVWIRADEELPDDDRYVLCCTSDQKGNKNIMRGYYDGSHNRWVNGRNPNVTHWMEMPAPPREGQKDE